jgi:hypothetical protein
LREAFLRPEAAAPTSPVDPGGAEWQPADYRSTSTKPDGTPSSAIVNCRHHAALGIPALLLMMTSFTKIFVVLAMARNALVTLPIPAEPGASWTLRPPAHHGAVITDINTHALLPALSQWPHRLHPVDRSRPSRFAPSCSRTLERKISPQGPWRRDLQPERSVLVSCRRSSCLHDLRAAPPSSSTIVTLVIDLGRLGRPMSMGDDAAGQ